jgi:hypothetical protein
MNWMALATNQHNHTISMLQQPGRQPLDYQSPRRREPDPSREPSEIPELIILALIVVLILALIAGICFVVSAWAGGGD